MSNRIPSPSIGEGTICIGEIKGAHGVNGLVRLYVSVDDINLFKKLKNPSIILKNKYKNNLWLANIEGVTSKEQADAMKSTRVFCKRDDFKILDEDEIYHFDLTGRVCVDENGTIIGTILGVQNFGAGDLLDIKPAKGGENFYLGLTPENILQINTQITVRMPEIL